MASLVSVNVGIPRDIQWAGKTVHTAVWKAQVSHRVMVRRLNIDGDAQGDLSGHGGEHRAVMVYQLESYRYWEGVLGRNDFVYGQFGENLTVEGLPDCEVCIGDRYKIGNALFEVTQPRVTCYRVGIRMNNPQMPALLVSHKRPGFYFRVIEEGDIGAGDEIVKVFDGPERMSVSDVDGLLYLPGHSQEAITRTLRIGALSDGWRSSLQALLGASRSVGNAGLAPHSYDVLLWTGFRELRVYSVERESTDVRSFTLGTTSGDPLPAAVPGQFLVVKIAIGAESMPLLRSYSISGSSETGVYRISVKRAEGLGSQYLHEKVGVGNPIMTSAPRGSFTMASLDGPIVLISAGIGATPVLSMLHMLATAPASQQRTVWWFYGTRNSLQHPFANEVKDLLSRVPNSRSVVAYSKPCATDRLGTQYDVYGRLSMSLLGDLPDNAHYYICGPTGFLDDFISGLKKGGVEPANIHAETFGSESSMTPGIEALPLKRPHIPANSVGSGPTVSFTRSGLALPWDSRYGSLLEFAEACEVPVRWSCRVGVCHNCETRTIDGVIQYSPEPLERPSDGTVLICCATSRSEIHLDL